MQTTTPRTAKALRTLARAIEIVEEEGVSADDMKDEDKLGCSVASHQRWMREVPARELRAWAQEWARE